MYKKMAQVQIWKQFERTADDIWSHCFYLEILGLCRFWTIIVDFELLPIYKQKMIYSHIFIFALDAESTKKNVKIMKLKISSVFHC